MEFVNIQNPFNFTHCQFLLVIQLSAVKISTNDWKGKKVVLVSVPGAFTVSFLVSFFFFFSITRFLIVGLIHPSFLFFFFPI